MVLSIFIHTFKMFYKFTLFCLNQHFEVNLYLQNCFLKKQNFKIGSSKEYLIYKRILILILSFDLFSIKRNYTLLKILSDTKLDFLCENNFLKC